MYCFSTTVKLAMSVLSVKTECTERAAQCQQARPETPARWAISPNMQILSLLTIMSSEHKLYCLFKKPLPRTVRDEIPVKKAFKKELKNDQKTLSACSSFNWLNAAWACPNNGRPVPASGGRRFPAEGAVNDNRRSYRPAHDTHCPALVWIHARPPQRDHVWLQHG